MKFKTLVDRYKNLGYKPKGLDRDLEITSIIKWIYEKHDIYIDVTYCSVRFSKELSRHKMFTGMKIWNTKKDYHNTFYCDKHFNNPFDAKFDAVREVYKAIKFQLY